MIYQQVEKLEKLTKLNNYLATGGIVTPYAYSKWRAPLPLPWARLDMPLYEKIQRWF